MSEIRSKQINIDADLSANSNKVTDLATPTAAGDAASKDYVDTNTISGMVIEDEGGVVTGGPHTTINFTGAGVVASDAGGGEATVTIAGGGGITIEDEGIGIGGGPHTTLDFVGAGVVATDAGSGEATITIAGGGAGGLPPNYGMGGLVKFFTTSIVDIGDPTGAHVTAFRDEFDSFDLIFGGALAADITVSGVGGLDTGVEASSTWYYVYIIGDTGLINSTDVILSASPVAPLLPITHDTYRRVGQVYNDSSSDFTPYAVMGQGGYREYLWADAMAGRAILSGGSATTPTAIAPTAVWPALASTRIVKLRVRTNGTSGVDLSDAIGGTPIIATIPASTEVEITFPLEIGTGTLYYTNLVGGGSTDIFAIGYIDDLLS